VLRWRTAGKSVAQFEPLRRRIERALIRGRDQTLCRRTAATCANLLKLQASLWTFLRDARVEPTNNDAERALRAIVIKRKISGPTRSRRGDDFIARAFTAQETCRRQGRDLWDFLHQADAAWIDKSAPPSLLSPACAQRLTASATRSLVDHPAWVDRCVGTCRRRSSSFTTHHVNTYPSESQWVSIRWERRGIPMVVSRSGPPVHSVAKTMSSSPSTRLPARRINPGEMAFASDHLRIVSTCAKGSGTAVRSDRERSFRRPGGARRVALLS
jgi:hypothetical protein